MKNKGGQIVLDPRQTLFREAYTNPESTTFGDAFKSAMTAGYSKEYAESITTQKTVWFSEIMRDFQLVHGAKRALSDFVENESDNTTDKRLRLDASKFVIDKMGRQQEREQKSNDETVLTLAKLLSQAEHKQRGIIDAEFTEYEEPRELQQGEQGARNTEQTGDKGALWDEGDTFV